jgi:hypothetical protein
MNDEVSVVLSDLAGEQIVYRSWLVEDYLLAVMW